MIYTKDHKTVNIFDPFDYLGPKRKRLIENSWAKIFRDEILPELPVNKLQPFYHSSRGAPTKELYAMLGLMILQQMHDFTVNLKRHHGELFDGLEKEQVDRYISKKGESLFSMVKPSESEKTLKSLSEDLFFLVERFKGKDEVTSMSSYKLLARLMKEQCIVQEDITTEGKKITVKPNKEVPSDSLQNPSDPDAGYSGHKGKGCQVQVAETYSNNKEDKSISLITHVQVESADNSDANALIPMIRCHTGERTWS